MVGVRVSPPKPGTCRPTFQPPPPPVQPHGDARHISIVPPLSLGRHVKRINEVPKSSYLKLRRDVDQFTIVRDSQDSRFHTNVQADIFTTIVILKACHSMSALILSIFALIRRNIREPLSSSSRPI